MTKGAEIFQSALDQWSLLEEMRRVVHPHLPAAAQDEVSEATQRAADDSRERVIVFITEGAPENGQTVVRRLVTVLDRMRRRP